MNDNSENVYLDQVLEQQARVDQELRARKVASAAPGPDRAVTRSEGRAVDYRITGMWIFQTVVVPPNVYVVHTRRGYKEPITIGLGISFRYNPYTDAFLVVPAAVQTILINARCICIERQGILVQAYVQWIVNDIHRAYRRLDFSDPEDPMRIVNVQLREQAEAAIKDKVATMSIDDVLSDKQPIIEELTLRLRAVAEGSRENPAHPGHEGDDSGLGLKIVTVQIKEAVVSSTRLWQNLQKPFRAEREKLAQMAELQAQQEITARQLENRQVNDSAQLAADGELSRLRAEQEQSRYDREQAETARRYLVEQESERHRLTERNVTEAARLTAEADLATVSQEQEARRIQCEIERVRAQAPLEEVQALAERQQLQAALALDELRSAAQAEMKGRELILARHQRQIDNEISEGYLRSSLIERLPEIAQSLPKPTETRSVSIHAGGAGTEVWSFLAGALGLLEKPLSRHDEEAPA